jgi:hypothetical protein
MRSRSWSEHCAASPHLIIGLMHNFKNSLLTISAPRELLQSTNDVDIIGAVDQNPRPVRRRAVRRISTSDVLGCERVRARSAACPWAVLDFCSKNVGCLPVAVRGLNRVCVLWEGVPADGDWATHRLYMRLWNGREAWSGGCNGELCKSSSGQSGTCARRSRPTPVPGSHRQTQHTKLNQ